MPKTHDYASGGDNADSVREMYRDEHDEGAAPFAVQPSGPIPQETVMSEEARPKATERDNRVEALGHAARHRLASEKPEDVVNAAREYFKFLQGDEAK